MRMSQLQVPRFFGPVVLSAVCLAALPAAAETYTWSKIVAGTYAWPDPANWGGAGFPNATNDVANLNIDVSGAITANLNGEIAVGVLNLGDGGAVGGNNGVNVQPGSGTPMLKFAASSGNAQLNIIGAGGGTVSASLLLDSPLDVTATCNYTLSGVITANGQTFTRAAGGGGGPRLGISANNSFANVAIRDGTVFISGNNTFAPGSAVTIDLASYGLVLNSMRGLGQGSANLPTLVLTKGIFQPSGPLFPLSNPMTINGDVQIGNSSFGGAMIHDGTVNLSGGTRTLSTSYGNAVIASPLDLYITDYANFAGAISNGGVIKASRSGMAFSGSNTYAGNTRITSGGLLLGQAASLPAAGTLQLRCGATVEQGVLVSSGRFYANQTWDRALGTGAGQFNWNDGATSSGGGFGAFADDLDDAGGDLIVALGTQKWGVAPFISAGDLIFGANLSNRKVIWTGSIDLAGATRTISAFRGYGNVPPAEIRGNLTTSSGTANLLNNANATGLIILSGTNTYNGTTTVNGQPGPATVAGGFRIAHPLALPNGNLIFGGGVLEGSADFTSWTNGLGSTAGTVRWSGGGGFSASGRDFTVNIGAAAAALTWGVTANFVPAGSSLTFGSSFADRTVIWTNPVVLATSGSATRDILARRGVGTVPEGRIAAVISDAGGTGSLSMSGPGTLELAAANTYSGITTINGIGTSTYLGTPNMGALRLGQVAALPAGNLVLNGGVLETRGSFYASQTFDRAAGAGANQVTWTSGGFAAYGTGASDDMIVANALPTTTASLVFGSPGANRTVRCTADVARVNDMNIVVHRGCGSVPEAELSGNITGAKALNVVAGSLGMLVLSGANGYTGATTVNCGWLRVGGASALPNGNLKLGSALIRQFGVVEGSVAWNAITRALGTGNGQIVWQQGGGGFSASGADLTVNLGGAAATLTWGATASFVPDRGVLAFGSPYADRTVRVQNPLDLGVRPMGTDSPVVASLMRELTVIRGLGTSPEVDLAGGVQGSEAQVGLLKNGDGILELSANNTYSGATLIQGGTLLVNGTLAAGGGLVTVGTGARAATLGGTGSVHRDVEVHASATVAPGASGIGTLVIDGDIAFATNSIFAVQMDGAACDKLSVSGSVSLDGAILVLDPISLPTRERVVVLANGGVSGEFGEVEGLPAGYFVRYDTGHVIVTRPAQGTQLLVR